MRTHVRAIAALVTLLGGATVLAGCGQTTDSAVDDPTHTETTASEDPSESTGPTPPPIQAGDDVEVPETWSEAVPLFTGGDLTSAISAADGTTLVWNAETSVQKTFLAYTKSLKDKGFSESKEGITVPPKPEFRTGTFEGHGIVVTIAAVASEKGSVLSVTARDKP